MALNSPGVEVKVIDESFYVPAEPGTRPLIVVSSKENKKNASGTGIAVGTLKANAGKPYLLTSQRDLADIFGTPLFYTDSSQNPIHGGELNEYGLQAAYSYLGVSNSAWVVRSDLDLGQLTPKAVAPNSPPNDGDYWFDCRDTHFGIFEWNGSAPTVTGGQKFRNKVPTAVITDNTKIDNDGAPITAIGKIGEYAVVATSTLNKIYYKNKSNAWVVVGSDDWARSYTTIQATKAVGTLTPTNSLKINNVNIAVRSSGNNNIANLVTDINANATLIGLGISAAYVNSRLEFYCGTGVDAIVIAAGTTTVTDSTPLVATNAADSALGIAIGTYRRVSLSIQSHTKVPQYRSTDSDPRPTGSIWIKTTNVNLGANWVVKQWSSAINDWKTVSAPVYANNEEAIYGLDRAGGGKNIARGMLYVQYNVDEDTNPLATFTLFRRQLPDPTTIVSAVIDAGTFENNSSTNTILSIANASTSVTLGSAASYLLNQTFRTGNLTPAGGLTANTTYYVAAATTNSTLVTLKATTGGSEITWTAAHTYTTNNTVTIGNTIVYSFDIAETDPGSLGYSDTVTVTFEAEGEVTDANIVAGAINGALPEGTNIVASVDSRNRIVINHEKGGEIALTEGDYDPLGTIGFIEYNYDSGVGTANLYTAPNGMGVDYVATNWKQLKATSSNTVPSQVPLDGTLWYTPVLDNVDIMIHNGNTWVGYLDDTSPYFSDISDDYLTDPNGPLVTATKPTLQSDGTPLRNGDLWIDTGDLENYPAMYKYDGYNLKWIAIDTSDQTTEDGVLFADARYNTDGSNSNTPGSISDLLYSNFIDIDAPDPDLYPRGMLLFNTRRSGNNVKRYVRNYINVNENNIRYNDESQNEYATDRWVNESGLEVDGRGVFGRKAQRKVVVKKLKALVDTNQLLRETEIRTFNLISCPGYVELISNMVNLNIDRKQTAFVIGDTPFRLPNDATSINDWGTNARLAVDNGEQGLVTYDEYLGVYYPSGFSTDNSGNKIVVPASHMVLRSIALSDGVSFPWFAPAGTRRGKVSNATSIGYVDATTGEWQSIALNEGQRDTLYAVSINPITFLTGAGNVIFGQKTRAANASALDRINVARLVVYLRGQLSKLAKPYIFEPNDKITRDELKAAAEGIMLELVGQRGIYDYLVVCDESNNTPSRIDRNELYLDIAIEPVKAVEFIYIPLRLKNTGEIGG